MAKKIALTTDWVTIGKAGKTADGRTIPDNWLTDAAETYDPETYTAVINAEHMYGNFGTVTELRTGKAKDGAITLEARMQPNKYMLQQNGEKYRLFTSMEINPKFAGTGKAYLTGLALTDSPASLATTELHFCNQKFTAERTDSVEIPVELFSVQDPENAGDPVENLLSRIKSLFNKNKDNNEMNDAQFKQLTDGLAATNAAISALVEPLTNFMAGSGKTETGKTEQPKTEAAKTDPGITKEQFNKLVESQKAMQTSIAGLTEKLSSALASGQQGTKVQAGTGAATDIDFV